MSYHDFRRRADGVRGVPLETVLRCHGAVRDRQDQAKWHTQQGTLSIAGAKFMNWQQNRGGGGAIDLVMHLAEVDFHTALRWLEQQVAAGDGVVGETTIQTVRKEAPVPRDPSCKLRLPVRDDRQLRRVRQYLTDRRHLSASRVERLVQTGRLYADGRGNAVFLLVAGKAHRPVGAELRGTGAHVWRGMARGTRKDLGYFWIGAPDSKQIILCESAIDAMSSFQIHPDRIGISTSGVRANPRWLPGLMAHGYQLFCGFDADDPGDAAAHRMMARHPSVRRLRPPAHDWNDALAPRD